MTQRLRLYVTIFPFYKPCIYAVCISNMDDPIMIAVGEITRRIPKLTYTLTPVNVT